MSDRELFKEANTRVRRDLLVGNDDAIDSAHITEKSFGQEARGTTSHHDEQATTLKTPHFAPPYLHLNWLPRVLREDHDCILEKDQQYNASWLSRGGVGAFMMLARKWDRLEPMVKRHGYDIFAMLEAHPDRIDDVQDLRRYLALVEAEWARRAGK